MTIENMSNVIGHVINVSITTYSFDFPVNSIDDIKVYYYDQLSDDYKKIADALINDYEKKIKENLDNDIEVIFISYQFNSIINYNGPNLKRIFKTAKFCHFLNI